MLKVLLVDDEPNVRQGIKMMIPWEEIGCEVIGEADDGDDGLSKIMNMQPDIVIADIKMPGKTGIEMTEAAKALGYKGKVLILSGYSDFSYAKTAIALGVENFILKPVDEDELTEAVKTAGEKINREREHRYKQEIGREYLSEQLVRGLFSGDPVQIAAAAEEYSYLSYCAAIVCCDGGQSEKTADYGCMRKFFDALSNVDVISVDISGAMGILFKGWAYSDAVSALRKLHSELSEKAFISCGSNVEEPSEICRSYSEAADFYRNRFIFRHCGVATTELFSVRRSETCEDIAQKIYAYMEINDTEKLNAALDSFMDSMLTLDNTPEKAKISCITLIMEVRSRIIRSAADKKPENMITDSFATEIGELGSLSEMVEAIRRKLIDISDSCFGKTTKSTMERVVQYIRANYNRELRLEILAGIFGYNSAYLGKVFHQYTGENFNNYLDEIRITEAKRLLSMDEYKVYEVAEMVGYSNINYFHNKFKKYVGMSPLSYKKQFGGGGKE